jgi:hypothetical protein
LIYLARQIFAKIIHMKKLILNPITIICFSIGVHAQSVNPSLSKELKTSLGTFTHESLTPVNFDEKSYEKGFISTTDGGTASFLINKEVMEENGNKPMPLYNSVKVFPNPFSTSATIAITADGKSNMQSLINTSITVYDILGNEVLRMPITNRQSTIERGNLSNGAYFYRVIQQNQIIGTGKFFIISNY